MKKKTAWLLAGMLLMMLPLAALAAVQKDEVVYARLSLLGAPEALYIVNAFEADEPAQVVDYGQYAEVVNLSGTDALKTENGEASLSLPEGRWFYQGNGADAQLPWQVQLSWQLDGEPVSDPKTLSGASGKLQLTLTVTPVEELQALSKGLAMQATIALDSQRARNIKAEHATVAWAAGDVTIAYAILPGMAANYTITADVADFALKPVQLAAVSMGVDAAMYRKMVEERFADTPLAAAAGSMMDGFMAGMTSETQPSFADSRNGNIRSLQFVILTAEVPAKPAAPAEQPTASPDEGGFIDRLLSLFGG